MKFRNILFQLFTWFPFYISRIHRETGETIPIDVDLQMASDTFKKLLQKEWISSMVTANMYLTY
jgi:hypothetical protein